MMNSEKHWTIGQGEWLQDDEAQRFYLMSHQGRKLNKKSQDLLPLTVGAHTHATISNDKPCSSGAYPFEFEHCPFCGDKLYSLPEDKDQRWIPPYGTGDGLRILKHPGFAFQQVSPKAVEFPLPRSSGFFTFVVERLGTHNATLLALDRSNGGIDVFAPHTREWVSLEPCGTIDDALHLPDWSWSLACDSSSGNGFCWPTAAGPCWVEIDWTELKYHITPGPGRCIGGAASLDKRIYVPTLDNDRFVVQVFDPQKREWSAILLEGQCPRADEYMSVPVVDGARKRIHWVGASGRLTLRQENSEIKLTWRPWETDAHPCHALPQYGPPYLDRVRNRYWQLCFDDHDQAYRFYEIEGDEHTDIHDEMEGDILSTGDVSFSKDHDYWQAPWDTPSDERADNIRLPLLQFRMSDKQSVVVVASLSGEQLINDLFESKQEHLIQFSLESRNDLSRKLQLPEVLKAKHPWQCKVFLFEDCLHLYVPDRLKCYRWPLNVNESRPAGKP